MSEVVFIYGQPQDPRKTFLYYYDRWETHFFQDADIEEGNNFAIFDTDRNRVISYEEVGEDPILFEDLSQQPGVEVYFSDRLKDVLKMLPPIQWKWTPWDIREIKSLVADVTSADREGPQMGAVSLKAKHDLHLLNTRILDINADGNPDSLGFLEEPSQGLTGYHVSLVAYWGSEDGPLKQQVHQFDYGEQVSGLEWIPPSAEHQDLGSFLIQLPPDLWRTRGSVRCFAYNSAPLLIEP